MNADKKQLSPENLDLLTAFTRLWGQREARYSDSGRKKHILLREKMVKYDSADLVRLFTEWIHEYLSNPDFGLVDEFFEDKMDCMMYLESNLPYIKQVTDSDIPEEVYGVILAHMQARKVNLICAWYKDMNDFYSDWCNPNDCAYSKEEADSLLRMNPREFQIIEGFGILRYVV